MSIHSWNQYRNNYNRIKQMHTSYTHTHREIILAASHEAVQCKLGKAVHFLLICCLLVFFFVFVLKLYFPSVFMHPHCATGAACLLGKNSGKDDPGADTILFCPTHSFVPSFVCSLAAHAPGRLMNGIHGCGTVQRCSICNDRKARPVMQ